MRGGDLEMAKRYVVRIIAEISGQYNNLGLDPDKIRLLLEQLRYAGVINWIKDEADRVIFDLYPPTGVSSTKAWAEANAARIRSFGINAAAAPDWIKVTF
jgi:hypothetical protein